MSIDVQIHGNDPNALAELIRDSIEEEHGMIDRELLQGQATWPCSSSSAEEDEGARRRDAWRWLNLRPDRDNDWSDV